MRTALALLVLSMAGLVIPVPGARRVEAASSPPAPQQKPNPLLLPAALDQYLQGEFDTALRVVAQNGFTVSVAERWVAAGGRSASARRRLAAAVCALEYAALRFHLIPELLPWARILVAGSPAPTAEGLWLRASVALAEGFGRWAFLTTGAVRESPGPGSRPAKGAVGHLAYARQRFPDDPHLQMAEAVGAEFMTSPATVERYGRFDRPPGFDRLGGDFADSVALKTSGDAARLEGAAATLQRLLAADSVGTEAHLRLGYVQFRLGQDDAALQHFDRVTSAATDRDLRYLGHLYAGLALARVNRAAESAASYRAALRVVPGARSATTLLTAVLLVHGQVADAEEVATEFIGGAATVPDPLPHYLQGDFRQFPRLIASLRELVR